MNILGLGKGTNRSLLEHACPTLYTQEAARQISYTAFKHQITAGRAAHTGRPRHRGPSVVDPHILPQASSKHHDHSGGTNGPEAEKQAGKKAYARREAVVEPVFGQIHARQGKHLLLQGLEKVQLECRQLAACHNLMKLHKYRAGPDIRGQGAWRAPR